jgi:hypothetical protein
LSCIPRPSLSTVTPTWLAASSRPRVTNSPNALGICRTRSAPCQDRSTVSSRCAGSRHSMYVWSGTAGAPCRLQHGSKLTTVSRAFSTPDSNHIRSTNSPGNKCLVSAAS